MKTAGNFWGVTLFAILLSACAGTSDRTDLASAGNPTNKQVRHDEPGEAAEFYMRKRLAPDMKSIPVERLLQGYEQMKSMTQYSSSLEQTFNNSADVAQRAPDAVLAAWSELGPGNVGGRTRAIVIDPVTPDIMYAGGVGGGVWKSINGGASWAPVSDTMANIAVVSLAMDPANPAVLYAGTGEGSFNIDALRGAGIFKSIDAGATWTRLAATTGSNFHYVNDLHVAPSNSLVVVAATNNGIFTSINGGTSFTQTSSEVRCLDLSVTTISGTDTWLAGCGNFSQGKVLRSVNASTWTQTLGTDPLDVDAMGRTAVAIRGNRAYAISTSLVPGFDRSGSVGGDYQNQLHAFFRSDDGGATWVATVRNSDPHWGNTMLLSGYFNCSTLGLGIGQGWYDIAVSIDPADSNYVWVGGVNLFRSADGGFNWGRGDSIHPDHHLITFHPQYDGVTNQIVFNGQDGGIYRTTNARAAVAMLPASTGSNCSPANPVVSWSSRNSNYAVTQFYHGTAYPNGTSYFAGAQDNGVVRGTDGGGANAWSYLTCGDGGYTAVNPANTNEAYASCQYVDIRKTTTGNSPFNSAISGINASEGSVFIPPFAMDPNNNQRLWFGGTRAWRTDNGAGSWVGASTLLNSGNDEVTAIAIAPGNSDLVLMAGNFSTNRIHRTTTATTDTTATAWTSTAVNGYVAALAFAPSNNSIAYASIATYGQPHVLKSIDGGASWTSASGSGGGALPDVPALGIVVHPNDANRVYVGTDIGVFVTLDGGANWAAEITSFPNVSTEWLQIIGSGNSAQLFAFTHGRGAFRLSLASGPGNLGFAQASQSVVEGAIAQVQVNRSSGSDGAVSVSYQTNNGSAIAPGDYIATSGTLNWAAGDASPKNIMVTTNADGSAESDETFTVTLATATGGATLGTSTHTVTLQDPGIFPPGCTFPAGYSTSAGSQPWIVATDSVQEGACSLKSNNAGLNSTNARIETTNTFVAGNVTFYARVSSEASYDCFKFLIDGTLQSIGNTCSQSVNPGVSGDSAWTLYTVPITAGAHTITWSYEKDDIVSSLSDAAWIDLVTLPVAPVGTPPVFTSAAPAGGTFGSAYSHTYTASGSPAPTFALQTGSFPSGLTLSGATLSGTPTLAGTYTGSVRASNSAGNVDQSFSITIAAIVPGAPTLTTLTPGNTTAQATFAAPVSNGGSAIIDYTASCTPGPITATAAGSPITITGLSNGNTYICTVTARNSAGSSAVSNALSVTPAALVVDIFKNGFE
ncbi:MAG TPA: Calx-beta domain-containing protein [Pseudomonadota bacterium]|nr:Calx-beta domain-containing protein [Pseudomonadota bacterium]